jgi:hypothetical protein
MASIHEIVLFEAATVDTAIDGAWIPLHSADEEPFLLIQVGTRTAGNVRADIVTAPIPEASAEIAIGHVQATTSNSAISANESTKKLCKFVRAKITVPSSGDYADVKVSLFVRSK